MKKADPDGPAFLFQIVSNRGLFFKLFQGFVPVFFPTCKPFLLSQFDFGLIGCESVGELTNPNLVGLQRSIAGF